MTRSTVGGSARVRQKKFTTKQPLKIQTEDQLDPGDDEAQRNVQKIETGVEKAEEVVSQSSLSHPYCDRDIRRAIPVWDS